MSDLCPDAPRSMARDPHAPPHDSHVSTFLIFRSVYATIWRPMVEDGVVMILNRRFSDGFLVQSIDFLDDDDDVSLSSSDDHQQQQLEEEEEKGVIHDDDDGMGSSSSSSPSPSPTKPRHHIQGYVRAPVGFVFDLRHNLYPAQSHDDDDVEEDGDDVDDDNDGYDIDDELVPWGVKNKFERQRMRKLGKRAFAKMTKSKKSAFLYTRPGCVRGKHGLGLKAY